MKLSDYYILTYANDLDQENQKNERKKVRNLVQKFKRTPDIFGGLSFDYLRVEEQAKMIHFFLEECNQREVINNLKKTNVDSDFSFLQFAEQKDVVSMAEDYHPICMDDCLYQIRDLIRFSSYTDKKLLEVLKDFDKQLFQALTDDYTLHTSNGIKLEWPEYVKGYIDYILNGLLQFLVYKIINSKQSKDKILEVISQLTRKADSFIGDFENVRKKLYIEADSSERLESDRVLQYFRYFIIHRNRLFENSEIYTILINEMDKYPELFKEVSEEYWADKVFLTEKLICSNDIQNIITENENVPNYKKKLATAREFITVMQKYGRRNCYDNCLQDIKVYFREIYISKQTYHRQKSSKIVEDYLQKFKKIEEGEGLPDFQKESQYIFIREKITRGYFREKNLSKAYADKCELTEKLNTLLLRAYWLADSFSALKLLHSYYQGMLTCIEEVIL